MQLIISGLGGPALCWNSEENTTLGNIKSKMFEQYGLPVEELRLLANGKQWPDNITLAQVGSESLWIDVDVQFRLHGGKGGFGSMLRSMGARAAIKQTTNFEACRDLNGRRLRNVHNEQKMAVWLAKEEERKQEKEEKKRQKQERMLRGPQHNFDHHKLGTEARQLRSTVDDALEVAYKKRKSPSTTSDSQAPVKKLRIWGEEEESSESDSESDEETASSSSAQGDDTTKANGQSSPVCTEGIVCTVESPAPDKSEGSSCKSNSPSPKDSP